jgi:hypothetical protein
MSKYAFAYHGGPGMASTEEEMAEIMAAIVDGGAPVGQASTVASDGSVTDGGGANPITGYSIISADSLEAAVALAKGCPGLAGGGSVEVAELIDM